MEFRKEIILKDGRQCILSSAAPEDAAQLLDCFRRTHGETEYLSSYEDETALTEADERAFILRQNAAPCAAEICAFVDGRMVGTAGFEPLRTYDKMRHRAEFGISVLRAYWGLGIGYALTEACIECARKADLKQLELEVVSENTRAVALYEKCGFIPYGRNPRAFLTRSGKWQENLLMRLEI